MNTDSYISSLHDVEIIKDRCRGNSTRIMNNAIELLFKKQTVLLEDHPLLTGQTDTEYYQEYRSKRLLKRLKRRLANDYDFQKGDLIEIKKNKKIFLALNL